MIRRILKKKKTLALTVVAVMAAAVAYAYFTTTGSGTGSGGTGSTAGTTLTISKTNPISSLTPGGSAPIDLRVANSSGQQAALKGITISIDSVTPAANQTCGTGSFSLTQPSTTGDIVVPANDHVDLASAGQGGTTAALNMTNSNSNQDGCKGATVNLSFAQTP
jgi:hypothetical protein